MNNQQSKGAPINGYHGTAPQTLNAGQTIPGVPGFVPPSIPTQGNSLGDTVYWLVHSIFDPRTLVKNDGTQEYSAVPSGYPYTQWMKDLLYRRIFASRPGRNEPDDTVLNQIIDNIADISRMIGIYCTAMQLHESRDPEMYQRARLLSLHDSLGEMQTILQYLPCPRPVLELNLKFIGLMDVSASKLYQNIGFLVNGDYAAFVTLYGNVRARTLGLNWMRVLFPEIGLIGQAQYGGPDVVQAFCNAQFKQASGTMCIYQYAEGASPMLENFHSAGMLHSVVDSLGGGYYTTTGWAVPGSGFGGVGAVRYFRPSLCRWNNDTDAAIFRTSATQSYSNVAGVVTMAAVNDGPLAANVAHEYNLNQTETLPMRNIPAYTIATGSIVGSSDTTAAEDTRYRVSSGFGLANLSYRYDANQLTYLAYILG